MGIGQILGFVFGTAFASGLNIYATIAVAGLLERFGGVHLPGSLAILGNPLVITAALLLYFVEFTADKIPYVDHAWDVLHTFIRPFAAAVLAYGATAAVPQEWRLLAALLAGGIALTSHGTKATMRVAVNASPEPFSNSIVSVAEDAIAIFFAWMATQHPYAAIFLVILSVAFCIFVLVKFFSIARSVAQRMIRRVTRRAAVPAS
ncbi:MAG: DUF4126 domain-containing protein [Candidatus Acidiferrales bacterium]|jgi:hypothetical protein|nr:DUF4126 domain-containing protein [Candidatus Acidoferrales bacterium]